MSNLADLWIIQQVDKRFNTANGEIKKVADKAADQDKKDKEVRAAVKKSIEFINAHEDRLNVHETNILGVVDRQNATESKLATAFQITQREFDKANANIKTNNDSVKNLKKSIDSTNDGLKKVGNVVAQNKKDIERAVELVDKKQKATDAHIKAEFDKTNAKVQANKTKTEANETALKTNKTAIDKNTAGVAANKAAIDKLVLDNPTQQIGQLNSRVDALDTRVNAFETQLNQSMATQAALSGLFQPYNVGKFNLSAAYGAYGNQGAVALGAGYRATEKLAIKGGAAVTSGKKSKATYNIAVNYEF
ncbi:surface protein A2H UspA2H [Moraxella macacae 0408225]|uniref:Surface protein A2H UspA2H n=1 Tax=Moraxella macacae 0408225 TaxID=1230338 RepID=L2FAX4_9GAMM|nr:surface protein A2H UspA2H [Moraxella macacae 0408225]